MERCGRYCELISAKLDGMLSPSEDAELQAHLANCANCRALHEQLSTIHAACAALEDLPAPDGFAQGVMAQIQSQVGQQKQPIPLFRRPQVRALAGLAACAALCLGLYQVGRPGQSAASQSRASDAAVSAHSDAADVPESYQFSSPALADEAADSASSQPIALGSQQAFLVTDSAASERPSARIVGSSRSLADLLALFPTDDLAAIAQTYGVDYFQSGQLLAVMAEAEGASSSCPLWASALTQSGVTLRYHSLPSQEGQSVWLILVEIPSDFQDGEALPVTYEAD
jgi:hypothetical protein